MNESATPRPSASVILVRDAAEGLETFMVRRHARSRVAASAFVFPGGTVRDDDYRIAAPGASFDRSDTGLSPDDTAAYFTAATRELFEEAGVLLAWDAAGQLLEVSDANVQLQERLASARLALQARSLSLQQLLQEYTWQPAFEALVPFSHWVTPTILATRFDTRFFVAQMPARQEALHCTIETSEGIWLTPSALVSGGYPVVYATAQHLRRVLPFSSVDALLEFARAKPIRRVQPEVKDSGQGLHVWLPPDLIDNW
jgi:8-oxo-dGTP pyrophosphatase MutT (NUDIX family)